MFTTFLQNPFIQGLGAGFAVCVAIGPIAILILRRTVADGRLAGFVSGLGAAIADSIIGTIAVLFLSVLLPILDAHNTAVRFVGGGVVISMGIFLLCTPPKIKEIKRPVHERNLLMACLTTCALTLTNPITLLSMTTIVSTTGVGGTGTTSTQALLLITGIFTASMLWWIFICTCAATLARLLGHGFLRTLNMVAAILVIAFGVGMIVSQAQLKIAKHEQKQEELQQPQQATPPPPAAE